MAALHFGMDPLETYRIARGLYEKKRISFPGSSRAGLIRRDFDDFKKDVYPAMCIAKCFKSLMGDSYSPYYTTSAKSLYNKPHGIVLTAFPLWDSQMMKEKSSILSEEVCSLPSNVASAEM